MLPPATYFVARLSGGEYGKSVDVFVRKEASTLKIVGIERNWPGKQIAQGSARGPKVRSSYPDLEGARKLFDDFTKQYNENRLRSEHPKNTSLLSASPSAPPSTRLLTRWRIQVFRIQSGATLGSALDLVTGIDRISGHQHGRQGDEQFRLYVRLRPGARETLEKSRQFTRSRENTIYHIGFPVDYRQGGRMPTLQISMSEDEASADIDVDYRSSNMPEAMWNGHLSSANSDVRAGDNHSRHTKRWDGLVNWWRQAFGGVAEENVSEGELLASLTAPEKITPLPPNRPLGATDIPELSDAAQEFLADWLVRHNYDEAMEFISDESLPCLVVSPESTLKKGTRPAMRKVLEESGKRFGEHSSLSTIISAVSAWGPTFASWIIDFHRSSTWRR